ncbi:Gfo/Idh/MocA family oxidoreductase [Novosphingobium sp. FSY-8]|uniref:Gfo/Idh/MocA family oxidoreductase n=1 Tax=Novosphingobium ovatum TaxID=1908523 RepID=A0ABW9XAA2_9SPHN|nr:Gfo/Idh/MocA family oxidoreductase [Novosphingobium ovatum]NBC35447.1 Gfo/Idh/MocA family oxidoreductase [Novosphingobium ovatum]
MTQPIGVGIAGTGMAFQAIHARTLAGLADQFAITAVWDPDASRAQQAADWLGARATASCEELFADPSVDVAVIASPARFHAEQALVAIRAGKRAVLVEKPLCLTNAEAQTIAAEAEKHGTALLVGTMHAFDPAWIAARQAVQGSDFAPDLIRSTIILPPNAQFEHWATEPLVPATAAGASPMSMAPDDLMRLCVLELAIHDLPLVRALLPSDGPVTVLAARFRQPFGYAIALRVGDTLVDISGVIHGHWQTDWTLEAQGPQGALQVEFTPSFVSAGSGRMQWDGAAGTHVHLPSDTNGYAEQWHAIARMLNGTQALPSPVEVAKDFAFAHAIAEQAARMVTEETVA